MSALPVHVAANVWIEVDTSGQVKPAETRLSVKAGQAVEWYCADKETSLLITFPKNRSPFRENEFRIPKGGSVCSGPIAVDPTGTEESFEYTVKLTGTEQSVTQKRSGPKPTIIIIRP